MAIPEDLFISRFVADFFAGLALSIHLIRGSLTALRIVGKFGFWRLVEILVHSALLGVTLFLCLGTDSP
jgi:hypothetical protein